MKIQKQLSIFLDNRPGTLARVCSTLAQNGINLLALTIADSIDHAVVRIVVSDSRKATHLLGNAGILVLEKNVVTIPISNRAGSLGWIAKQLASAKINIEYAYCTAEKDQAKGLLVMRTSDARKTLQVLRRLQRKEKKK